MTLRDTLERGSAELDLALPAEGIAQMLRHLELLAQWNRRYNLTAIREPEKMVTRHLLDCLAVLPYAPGGRLLDLGTGAGFPGIPLALARPNDDYTLVDSSLKRIRFVRHVVAQLKIRNVRTLHRRVETLSVGEPFDAIVSRAFAAPDKALRLAAPLLRTQGSCLVMCGQEPDPANLDTAPHRYEQTRTVPLRVPLLGEARHLLIGTAPHASRNTGAIQ